MSWYTCPRSWNVISAGIALTAGLPRNAGIHVLTAGTYKRGNAGIHVLAAGTTKCWYPCPHSWNYINLNAGIHVLTAGTQFKCRYPCPHSWNSICWYTCPHSWNNIVLVSLSSQLELNQMKSIKVDHLMLVYMSSQPELKVLVSLSSQPESD